MIGVSPNAVWLYVSGTETEWDIELFDASLVRYCHEGCALEAVLACGDLETGCDICETKVVTGALEMRCYEHDYDMCAYCLGRPCLPKVGKRVIRGPTWEDGFQFREDEDDYDEEGVVETDLLDGSCIASTGDDIEVSMNRYHTCFRVRWLKSGRTSYCRAPPYQDATPASCAGNQLENLQSDKKR